MHTLSSVVFFPYNKRCSVSSKANLCVEEDRQWSEWKGRERTKIKTVNKGEEERKVELVKDERRQCVGRND